MEEKNHILKNGIGIFLLVSYASHFKLKYCYRRNLNEQIKKENITYKKNSNIREKGTIKNILKNENEKKLT